MEYEKRIRCLENYRVRSIPKDIVTTNSEGEEIVDKLSPRYFYGKIPDFKIDKNFNYILDGDGQKIPNTIPINIFLKHKYDDLGIFTNSIFINERLEIEGDDSESGGGTEVAGYICRTGGCIPTQTLTELQNAVTNGYTVFITSNYISAQAALDACQRAECENPGEGNEERCEGNITMARGGYLFLNGSLLSEHCCKQSITGVPVSWNGEYCKPE